MPKHKKNKYKRGPPKPNVWRADSASRKAPQADFPGNPEFTEYYKAQGVIPEGEWDDFVSCMCKPLPITFRINGGGRFALDLRNKLLNQYFNKMQEPVEVDGQLVHPPHELKWYPNSLAWQLNCSRHELRRLPALSALFELIKHENEVGAITRQEAVSMVPPLFLNVEPHHKVLDMCAAPGSKTIQLLEMLHTGPSGALVGVPPGFVLANDVNNNRCSLLVHQTRRMSSPNLMVTNHPGQQFPLLSHPDGTPFTFDRILCDVPCSGDGTLRKALDIWEKWSSVQGNGLHPLQVAITTRACRLLAVGGRLVYSTCSLNPIEDEAVVAEVLRRSQGKMQLVDVADQLPQLKRLPGLSSWRVRGANGWVDSYKESTHKTAKAGKLVPSMFHQQDCASFNLHRCMRLLPHHNDAGGFFVAVMEKVGVIERDHPRKRKAADALSRAQHEGDTVEQAGAGDEAVEGYVPLDAAAAAEATEPVEGPEAAADVDEELEEADDGAGDVQDNGAANDGTLGDKPRRAPKVPKEGSRWVGIDPITFYEDDDFYKPIRSFYGLKPGFPLEGNVCRRASIGTPTRRVHFVAPSLKQLVRLDVQQSLRIPVIGLKIFERQTQSAKAGQDNCGYRIVHESLPLLLPYVTKQVAEVPAVDFLSLLENRALWLRCPRPDEGVNRVTEGAAAAEEAVPADVNKGAEGVTGEVAEQLQDSTNTAARGGTVPAPVPLKDPATEAAIAPLIVGCIVVLIREDDCRQYGLAPPAVLRGEQEQTGANPMALLAWRGTTNIMVLVAKPECLQSAMRLREAMGLPAVQMPSKTYRQHDTINAEAGAAAHATGVAAEAEMKQSNHISSPARTAENGQHNCGHEAGTAAASLTADVGGDEGPNTAGAAAGGDCRGDHKRAVDTDVSPGSQPESKRAALEPV